MSKFFSRKLFVAIAGFITVYVLPHITEADKAKWSALIAAVYMVAQGYADRGAGTGSQGDGNL